MLLGDVQLFNNIPVPVRVVLLVALVAFGGWVLSSQVMDLVRDWQTTHYGEPALGWVVQANDVLYQRGREHAAAVVLVSPDDDVARDEEFMTGLAERMMELKGVRGGTKEERYVSRLVTDEAYVPGKRDRLPRSFTEGEEVYAAHVIVQRALLPERRLVDPFVCCLIPWRAPGAPMWTIAERDFRKRKARRAAGRHRDDRDD